MTIINKILEIIYPQTCGICGKIYEKPICNRCKIKINNLSESNVIKKEEFLEDRYFDEISYLFKYEGQIRKLILDYKFNEKSYLYKTFVEIILNNEKILKNLEQYDIIIPVPISKKRRFERGYNQSYLIAKEIAKKCNKILENNCIKKKKNIIEQSKLNKEDRKENIKGVYELQNKELIYKKNILLVDDIFTTGSTVNECSRILKCGNPSKIGIFTLAKD